MIKNKFNKGQNEIMDKVEPIKSDLNRFALSLTKNKEDAEDLYQNTMLQIIRKADKYKKGTNFKAWAKIIMKNLFINDYRKKTRRGRLLDGSPNYYLLNAGKEKVSNKALQAMDEEALMAVIDKSLSKKFKTVFMMHYEGYKYEEISQELGVPLGTVKSRLFFARNKIRKNLGRYGFDEILP